MVERPRASFDIRICGFGNRGHKETDGLELPSLEAYGRITET